MSKWDDEIGRYWDAAAPDWAAKLGEGEDIVNELVGIPSFLDMVGDLTGQSVLDAGCGEGRSARHLARLGARVTGVDLSSGMLAQAQREEERRPLGIDYHLASISDLQPFEPGSFDAVVSIMALMDAADYRGAVRACARVLRPGGRFAFMVLHPCFFTRSATVIRNDKGERARVAVGDYFDDQAYVQNWRFSGDKTKAGEPFAVPRFPRQLSDYLNGIVEEGLRLDRVTEPRPSEAACRDYPFLGFWRRHGAIYLCVRAEKPA